MAQFDVYRNPNPATRDIIPYLLDVQTDLLEPLTTRVVAPLVKAQVFRAAQHLNPSFTIEGEQVIMSTAELAGVSRRALSEVVGNLRPHREAIIAALDFLFTGI